MSNTNTIYSTTIKAGKTSYFVDVKKAKNGNNYLSISETSIDGEERKRKTILVFGENIERFRQAIDEAAQTLSQQ